MKENRIVSESRHGAGANCCMWTCTWYMFPCATATVYASSIMRNVTPH